MAVGDITKEIRVEKGNGYQALKSAISKKKDALNWKITRRDILYLLNKQFEGVSETKGNLFIYMFYYSCTDASEPNSEKWYNYVVENDGPTESTPWCACYVSFILNMAGITSKGNWASKHIIDYVGLDGFNDFSKIKSFDVLDFASSHVGFAVREDKDKPNDYSDNLYVIGGNQGDTVKLAPTNWFNKKGYRKFGTSSSYDEKVSAGDVLSLLAYFEGSNNKTPKQRIIDINCRIKKESQPNQSDSTKNDEVMKLRNKISDKKNSDERTKNKNPYFIFDNNIRNRIEELLIFEKSLQSGSIPLSNNIAQVQTKVKTSN